MSVLYTSIARIKDWQTLEAALAGGAAPVGRLQVLRNVQDASQVLLLVELPDHEAIQEVSLALEAQVGHLLTGGPLDHRAWERLHFNSGQLQA